MNAIQVFPIGKIENADGNTRIVLQNEYAAGLKELEGYSHALILWWMDGCDNARDTGQNPARKAAILTGVPNSISDCKIWKRNGDGICRAAPIANFYIEIFIDKLCCTSGAEASYLIEAERSGAYADICDTGD